MIERIIAGEFTDADIAEAKAFNFDQRRKLLERMLDMLADKLEEADEKDDVVGDLGNALKQVRPVLAAGLGIDQSVGMVAKLCQDSIDSLEGAGAADSAEYDKERAVLKALEGFIKACEKVGTTSGDEAFNTIHFEYRGHTKELEQLQRAGEVAIANSLGFLGAAFGRGDETEAFAKGIDRNPAAARFIGKFGSTSFFMYKKLGTPGHAGDEATEGDCQA